MNIVRYDPLDLVEGMMKSVLRPSFEAALQQRDGAPRTVPVDVAENDTSYFVWADLPGVRKEDVSVSIVGNQLSISAQVHAREKQADQGQGQTAFLLNERFAGSVARTLEFAGEIDEENARAEYRDGVLALVLPKKPSAQVKRLAVH